MFRVRLNPYPNPCTRSHSCRRKDRRRVRGTPQHVGNVGMAPPDVVVVVGPDRRTGGNAGSRIGPPRASMSQEGARARRRISVARRPNSGIHDRGHGRVPDATSCRAADPESGTRNQPREPRLNVGRASVGRRVMISTGPGGAIQRPMMASLHRTCTSVDRPLHEH